MAQLTAPPFGLRAYRSLMRASGPLVDILLRRRSLQDKEDPRRLPERRGIASLPRPDGMLIWFHCASVGESLSVLPLLKHMNEARPDLHFLVTTGTLTSARLMAERLPANAFHQFLPFDHPSYCAAFFSHWRPELGVIVESELWPNLLLAAASAHVPLVLANARLSIGSFKGWRRARKTIQHLLDCFQRVFAQDEGSADRLRLLGAHDVRTLGNLKYDGVPLPVDPASLQELVSMIGTRPSWIAASTHEGEEAIAARAHEKLKPSMPGLLTIIVPRHPARGDQIAAMLREDGLVVAQRSHHEPVGDETDIYLGDTLGEMGLFYSQSCIAFVGGSLVPVGGHNPLEPARLNNAVLFGPHMHNFETPASALLQAGAAYQVDGREALVAALQDWLSAPQTAQIAAVHGKQVTEQSVGVAARVADDLLSLLPPVRET